MALDARRAQQAASFGAAADAYERGRPSYPPAAVDWLLPPQVRRVLDLGAGTGKLTRLVAARPGLEVVAVEPSDGMRETFAAALPGIEVLAGTAEEIPAADGSFDAVLVAQAWHWVDPAVAVPEVARVLARGGTLGLVWNVRDESVPWVRELGGIIHRDAAQEMGTTSPPVGPPFGTPERLDVPWTSSMSRAQLLDMAASRSYVITLGPPDRAALLSRVEHLLDHDPALAGRATVDLPYVTRCHRAHLTT